MTCNINSNGTYTGLDEAVYKLTPPAQSDFRYSVELEFCDEPDNVIEEIRNVFGIVFRMFGVKQKGTK